MTLPPLFIPHALQSVSARTNDAAVCSINNEAVMRPEGARTSLTR